jgi:hypothetical protein
MLSYEFLGCLDEIRIRDPLRQLATLATHPLHRDWVRILQTEPFLVAFFSIIYCVQCTYTFYWHNTSAFCTIHLSYSVRYSSQTTRLLFTFNVFMDNFRRKSAEKCKFPEPFPFLGILFTNFCYWFFAVSNAKLHSTQNTRFAFCWYLLCLRVIFEGKVLRNAISQSRERFTVFFFAMSRRRGRR